MNVAIRVDASIPIGTGHLMRCLTLADELRRRGATVHFICRAHTGHLGELVETRGHSLTLLPIATGNTDALATTPLGHAAWLGTDAIKDALQCRKVLERLGAVDWLVVDHYALDEHWETELRPCARQIMVIDDLADRRHVCDVLLDQNYHWQPTHRYIGLVPETCRLLLGPNCALLRPEFLAADREQQRVRGDSLRRILVFFGGSDSTDETAKSIAALRPIMAERPELTVDVVIGANYGGYVALTAALQNSPRFEVHRQVYDMAALMRRADLAIGAGGATTWERCFLGLPSIVMILADNQRSSMQALAETGAILLLGDAAEVEAETIGLAVRDLMQVPARLGEISRSALSLMKDHYSIVDFLRPVTRPASRAVQSRKRRTTQIREAQ